MSTIEPLRIKGMAEFQGALKQMSAETQSRLDEVTGEAAKRVATATRRKVPSVTGAAKGSVGLRTVQGKSTVVTGGTKAPYFPWLDFGGRVGRGGSVVRAFRPGGRYLFPAQRAEYHQVMDVLNAELVMLAEDAGLEVH